jgi:saccharopine dehydrogenase-like NADP-dependent oxidoreductase
VVVADCSLAAAQKLVSEIGGKALALAVDVNDTQRLVEAMGDSDVVLNTLAPY